MENEQRKQNHRFFQHLVGKTSRSSKKNENVKRTESCCSWVQRFFTDGEKPFKKWKRSLTREEHACFLSPRSKSQKRAAHFPFRANFLCSCTTQIHHLKRSKTVGGVMAFFPSGRAYLALHGGDHHAVSTCPGLCSRVFTRRVDVSRWTHVCHFSQPPHAPLHRPWYSPCQGFFLRIAACSSIQRRTRRLCSPSKDRMLSPWCAHFPYPLPRPESF